MSLYLHRSNRTERLVDALSEIVRQPLSDVFAPEWITVSSPGMERWLSMQLAQRLGVWANPHFPFPRKLIETCLNALSPEPAGKGLGYDPTCMLFGIARQLRERASEAGFEPVRRYCAAELSTTRRLALAARLAELFDQYLVYRPELVLEWAHAADSSDFQALLFHALARQHGPEHVAARARSALSRVAADGGGASLPQRLHLFGVSSLPPLYVSLLAAVAQHSDVHVYLLSPSREYYGDLRSRREQKAQKKGQLSFGEGFRPETHALLASLGRHGREFHELLEERTQYRELDVDLYEEPGEATLLHTLQADLLALRMRGAGRSPRALLAPDDCSLSVHACHGPMREVEVLHDQLAQSIAEGRVAPHEVIVMTPNIGLYAPLIDAVFLQAREHRPQIPFRIADKNLVESEPLLIALDAVLDLLPSRFGANQVLDLLGIDLIRQRFDIAPEQVESLREWVEDSGIRWGIDAAHRAEFDQPLELANTWRFGLARLALGFCTDAAPEALFNGISPLGIETGQGELLGQFMAFCETLFELRQQFAGEALLPIWAERIALLCERCCAASAIDPRQQRMLQRATSDLVQHAARAGFVEPLDLDSLRALLTRTLGVDSAAHGFLAGGVTFCQLLPMRSIPFKVIGLLGLSDGAFPASDAPFAFDRLHQQRKPGDRSRRDDDRQLFLEALLCARESLLITYVGHSLKDGKELAPSVLVSELLDHVVDSVELPGATPGQSAQARATAITQRIVVKHPLSAANPSYFGAASDPRLFSYATLSLSAARARTVRKVSARPAFAQHAVPRARELEVRLADLERCLMRPTREFCQRRLGLYLGEDAARLPEREPLTIDALTRWKVANDLLEGGRRGMLAVDSLAVESARGRMPLGALGERRRRELQEEIAQMLGALAIHTESDPLPPLDVDLQLDGVRLTGRLEALWPSAQVQAYYTRAGSRHELRYFIRHVVLHAMREACPELRLPEASVLIVRERQPRGVRAAQGGIAEVEFGPVANPRALLAEWLELYMEALTRPLPLFAGASRSYAYDLRRSADSARSREFARAIYSGTNGSDVSADGADAYVRQVYEDFDSVLEQWPGAFERAASAVYGPLLAHGRER